MSLSVIIFAAACSSNENKVQIEKQNLTTPGAIAQAPKSVVDFYNGPAQLPSTKLGDIIYSQALFGLDEQLNGWRVLYVTSKVDGTPTFASASIYAPRDDKPHNLVIWAHGSLGIADECAPSRSKDGSELIANFDDYINKGYAVIAPDYEGFGTPGTHPFLVGESEGRTVLDSVRMAQNFEPINPIAGAVIVGHSQGGQSALFAGELRASYAPEVSLSGVVAIAPAGELLSLFEYSSTSGFNIGFIVMTAIGFKAEYEELDLTQVLTDSAIEKSSIIERGCLFSVLDSYKSDVGTTFTNDPETIPSWKAILDKNSPGKKLIDTPTLLVHGLEDSTVPSLVSQNIFTSTCALGTAASRETYTDESHGSVLFSSKTKVMTFIKERFDNKEFISTCS
jgi:pimeloyl-ACP methyl ester carboxylesterase